MKKLFLILSLLIMASMVLAACAPAATPTEAPPPEVEEPEPPPEDEPEEETMLPDLGGREITIAVENAYPPYNYEILETNEAGGWDYDFVDEACARLNCVPVWREIAWDPMIAAVADGLFDMATDGITITEERAEMVDFSDGYAAIDQRLLVRIDDDRFSTIEELVADPEAILGEQIGTTNYNTALKYIEEERIVGFDTFPIAVAALIAGDVDGVILDETAGQGYIGTGKEEVKLVGPSLSADRLGFIFPKGSDLVEPFNMIIAQFIEDGTLADLNALWFSKSEEDIVAEFGELGDGAYAEEE